jgi:hypothetical protein
MLAAKASRTKVAAVVVLQKLVKIQMVPAPPEETVVMV